MLNKYYIEAECDPVAISDAGFSISSDSSANGFVEQSIIPTSTTATTTSRTAHTSAIIGDGNVSNSSSILSEAVSALETIRFLNFKII